MTQAEIIDLIITQLEDIDGSNIALTASGMICADLEEFGFDAWVNMPAVKVVESHLEATEAVAEDLLEDIEAMISQEKQLDSLGVDQSMRIDTMQVLIGFKGGIMDIFRSLVLYFASQEQAKSLLQHDTH